MLDSLGVGPHGVLAVELDLTDLAPVGLLLLLGLKSRGGSGVHGSKLKVDGKSHGLHLGHLSAVRAETVDLALVQDLHLACFIIGWTQHGLDVYLDLCHGKYLRDVDLQCEVI